MVPAYPRYLLEQRTFSSIYLQEKHTLSTRTFNIQTFQHRCAKVGLSSLTLTEITRSPVPCAKIWFSNA